MNQRENRVNPDHSIWQDDPVKAYDAVAQSFALLTAERRAYLDAVDRLVIANLPRGAKTLLDVGAGDARRSKLIAAAAGCSDIVLVEPSAGMRRIGSPSRSYVDLRVESLDRLEGEFDITICLWNVLGHVFPAAARAAAMAQFRRLLSPRGRLFIDVNHRYNAVRYGFLRTAGRFIHDVVHPSERNGDVLAKWRLDGREYGVRGHVFTAIEFDELAESAGLSIERRFILDYQTGAERDFAIQGNPLYVMKRG